MTHLVLPGLHGSGPGHWQAWWLGAHPDARLIEQRDFAHPRLEEWRDRVARAVEEAPGAILIAHSLASVLVAQLAQARPDLPVRGALLVAPADVDDAGWTNAEVASFGPVPRQRLPFPSIVVASRNDPYVSFNRARQFASRWGSDFVDIGNRGHINADSGFGPWPQGIAIAARLEEAADGQRRRAGGE